jgi:hypothetical protein
MVVMRALEIQTGTPRAKSVQHGFVERGNELCFEKTAIIFSIEDTVCRSKANMDYIHGISEEYHAEDPSSSALCIVE